jgi:hypothetical protein
MAELRPQSQRDARTIKSTYAPLVDSAMFVNRGDLEAALEMEELALLPDHIESLNIQLRLNGANPIAEKDLANQAMYLGARPSVLSLLYDIAARVESGPIEITSLVRHGQYQRALSATNGNARTEVPTHAMGLAFDIALVNTPMPRVQEIRRVLQQMRAAGDILFIGERQQLVFHVVPHPSRLGYFTGIYQQAVGSVSGIQTVEVVAPGPYRVEPARLTPRVVTEVVAVSPVSEHWAEWRDATTVAAGPTDSALPAAAQTATGPLAAMVLMRGMLAFFAALGTSIWKIANHL